MTEQPSGRFAGDIIDDEVQRTTGIYQGSHLSEPHFEESPSVQVEPQDEKAVNPFLREEVKPDIESTVIKDDAGELCSSPPEKVNPADLAPRMQKASTAVGVPPQIENLFAGETLSETPVAKSGERKAGVAKRSKKASPELVTALTLESQQVNTRRNPFAEADTGMHPTIKEPDRIKDPLKRTVNKRPDGTLTSGQKIREFFERTGKIIFAVTVGLLAGTLLIGWAALTFGSWQATEQGIYSKTLIAPINALPEGTPIVMTQVGTVKPEFPATLVPVILNSATSTIVAPIFNESNQTIGYTVKCTGGSCNPGLLFDIPLDSIIAQG